MSRRRKGRDISGILLLDKPAGISSNHALQKVRRLYDAKKGGHTGSLDPFATGMLPICLGEASKTAAYMLDADKCYEATAVLGVATATGDTEGEVIQTMPLPAQLGETEISAVFQAFVGDIMQVPPMYSALKVDGKPLYELARQGITIERKARPVSIFSLELLDWQPPELKFRVSCSKGTYIRTLAEDIGKSLHSCGHLRALRRLWVEPFQASEMVTLDTVERIVETGGHDALLLAVDAGLLSWRKITLAEVQINRFCHGNWVMVDNKDPEPVRVYRDGGKLLGLGSIDSEGKLSPSRLFHL